MPKVLVVDDEPFMVRLLRLTLQDMYDVYHAYDGAQALALIRENAPDLVILDISMPGPSGLELLSLMRESEELHSIKVIVLTGSAEQAVQDQVAVLGADGFLTKPFSPRSLLEKVADALKDR